MLKASEYFTKDQQTAVEASIAEAETKTSCEFVTVIASASGRYDRGEDIAGIWLGSIFMVIAWVVWPIQQSSEGTWEASSNVFHYAGWLAALLLGFIIGAIVSSRVGKMRLLFTPRQEQVEEVESKAKQAFFDQRVHRTDGGTGVLVYISLFEQMVTILTDETVKQHLSDDEVSTHCTTISKSLAHSSSEGLVSVLTKLGDHLAKPMPCASDDINELGNAIIFMD